MPPSAPSLASCRTLLLLITLTLTPCACNTGFGFLEFEEKDDAAAAIDNMHNAEIYGRILRVNYAQPMKIKGGDKGWR